MVTKKTWDEFRCSGLLLIINSLLHVFGWAIVVEIGDDGKVSCAYPARVKYRGFDEKTTTEAHKKVAEYLKNNIDQLAEEANM